MNSLLVLISVIIDHAFGAQIVFFLKIQEHIIAVVYSRTIYLRTFINFNISLGVFPTIFAFDFCASLADTLLSITAVKTLTFLFEGTLALIAPLCQSNLFILLVMHSYYDMLFIIIKIRLYHSKSYFKEESMFCQEATAYYQRDSVDLFFRERKAYFRPADTFIMADYRDIFSLDAQLWYW